VTDVEVRAVAPPGWDEEIAGLSGANPFQTSAWARYAAAYLGEAPRFLRVTRAGRPRAWLLASVRSAVQSLLIDRPLPTALVRLARRMLPTIGFLRGPLFAPDAVAADVEATADALQRLASTVRTVDGRIAIHGGGAPHAMFLDEIERRGWGRGREATLIVDLDRTEDALWRALKPAARKDVRRAERSGVTVRVLRQRSELAGSWDVLRESRRRLGLHTYSIANLYAIWDRLRPGVNVDLLVGEQAGEIVAGLGIWSFAHVAVEFAAAQSDRAVRERLYASDLVTWSALKHARSGGASSFDLAGIAVGPGSAKEAGIRQFKEKWGGTRVEAPLIRPSAGPR
jgi:hypothetical protein